MFDLKRKSEYFKSFTPYLSSETLLVSPSRYIIMVAKLKQKDRKSRKVDINNSYKNNIRIYISESVADYKSAIIQMTRGKKN